MDKRWCTLEKFSYPIDAMTVKSFLEGYGIPCVAMGLHVAPTHPFFSDPIELQVPKNRFEEAKALLEACRQQNVEMEQCD